MILHAEYANGTSTGLHTIESAKLLSRIGSGPLYKEALAQRSAKQILGVSSSISMDSGRLLGPESGINLSSVLSYNASKTQDLAEDSNTDVITNSLQLKPGSVGPRTKMSVAACKYRIVFTIDASPSMATLDPVTGEVLLDQVYVSLERILTALVSPIRVGFLQFSPRIHASFILQGSSSSIFHVMLHGLLITSDTLSTCLQLLKQELSRGETSIISKMIATGTLPSQMSASTLNTGHSGASNGMFSTPGASPMGSAANAAPSSSSNGLPSFTTPDLGSPLKNSMFVLKMLPLDSCPLIVLVTDGVTTLPEEAESYDSLLMLMSREDIACSAIQVGSGYHDFSSFAYIPDANLLKHFVSYTGGAYFDLPTLLELPLDAENPDSANFDVPGASCLPPTVRANKVQSALLFRTAIGAEKAKTKATVNPVEMGDLSQDSIDAPFPWEGSAPRQLLYRIPYRQYQLVGVNVLELLASRYREGFAVHKLHLDGRSPYEFSAKLSLPWKENVFVIYTIKATCYNDIPNSTPEIQVALDLLSHYDVQGQWSQMQRTASAQPPQTNPAAIANPTLVQRLQQYLLCIIDTDKKLSGLTSQTITLNEIMGRSLQTPLHVQIEKLFWKCLSQLPKNLWHRWFKMERMEIILLPDLLLNTTGGSAASAGSRIELRRKHDDLINPISVTASGSLYPDISNGPSSRGDQGHSLVFRYDSAVKDLQTYFENWNCFSGSKHSFARILEHTLVTGSNASQIIASIASKPELDPTSKKSGLGAKSSPHPEARTLTVPGYCVLRLTWESKNVAMLTFYFFGVHSADRFRIMHAIQQDLLKRANPNDPTEPLFSICSKPLRYSLVRYPMAQLKETMPSPDNAPSLLSNLLPTLLSPVQPPPPAHPLLAALPANPNASSSIADRSSTPSSEAGARSKDHHHHHHRDRNAPPAAAEPVNGAPTLHQTEDLNIRTLVSFAPIYHLLVNFMHQKRWIWNINSEVTQEAAIEAIVRCRLNEGFLLLANSEMPQSSSSNGMPASHQVSSGSSASQRHLLHSFYKEIRVSTPLTNSLSSLGANRDTVEQLCVAQYLTYHTPQGYLVTELWVEPTWGSASSMESAMSANAHLDDSASLNRPALLREAFQQLKSLIYEVDLHVISTIATFDTLALLHNPHTTRDILSVPTEVKEYALESSVLGDVSIQRPPFNLKGLAAVAVQHEESFTGFESDDNTPLHRCLHASLSYLSDRQLPNKGTFSMGEPGSPVFTKALPNSPELLLVALHPISSHPSSSSVSSLSGSSAWSTSGVGGPSSGQSTPLYPPTPTLPFAPPSYKISVSASPLANSAGGGGIAYLPGSSSVESGESVLTHLPQTRLCVTVYQCSRVVEPPASATAQIQRILDAKQASTPSVVIPTTEVPGTANASTTSAIHQLCESLQNEHRRGFAKSLFMKLSNGKANDITPADHNYALQICPEYMMEMDLTQFFRIVAKYHSHEEDGAPRRGLRPGSLSLGSFGSDSSSPLDTPTLDTALLFDRLLAHQFRKVPQTEAPIFFSTAYTHPTSASNTESETSSDVDSDAAGMQIDEDVAIHIPTNLDDNDDQVDDPEDLDDWIDDLSKRHRSAAVITSANASSSSTSSSQQASSQIIAQALNIWSTLPFFMRMECAIVPKSGSSSSLATPGNVESVNHWGGADMDPMESRSASLHPPVRRNSIHSKDSPGTPRSRQLRPSNTTAPSTPTLEVPYDTGVPLNGPLNVTSFPITTLPNPKQISALQQLSTSGNRAFLRVYALVLPKRGEEGYGYDGNSPADMTNSPASMDGNSPLAFGGPLSSTPKDLVSRQSNAYTKLPKQFRRILEQLKVSVRSLTAQKSLDILRSRVPVTRVISDIVTMNMKQLNPNAYTTMKIPLTFVDAQQGISLFFNEFAKWSLQPIRVIDRTLFFVVQPTPSIAFPSPALSLGISADSSSSSSHLTAPSGETYTVPYWLFMTPTSTHVHIRFQSTPGVLKKREKAEVLEKTRESVNFVVKRINQIILLTQLFEHRVCNVLLSSDPNNPSNAPATASDDSEPSTPRGTPILRNPESPTSGPSRPISIPQRDAKEKKRGELYESPHTKSTPPSQIDEEGIFEHDEDGGAQSPRDVPEAPRLPSQMQSNMNQSPIHAKGPVTPRITASFRPAQFSCEKVHEIVIPLNWRTDPKTILNAIAGSVLVHFSVSNRPKMYVYREQSGKIFYMTLAITSNQDDETGEFSDSAGSRSTISRNTEPSALDLVTSSVSSSMSVPGSVPNQPSINIPGAASNATSSAAKPKPASSNTPNIAGGENTSYLTLRVYGIDTPSEEITVQLRTLLETKLAYFTLQVISTMLLRNPLMKIKPADENFLRGPETSPRHFQIELPPFISDLGLFKAFMKANLLKQGLTLLNLEAERPPTETGMAVPQRSGRTPETSESLLATPQIQAAASASMATGNSTSNTVSSSGPPAPSLLYGDSGAVYLYNNLVSGSSMGHSKAALNFGTGLATLSVTIQTPQGPLSPMARGNSFEDFSIGSSSSYETGPLFEPMSLEDSPMHDLFLNVLSSSEVASSDPIMGINTGISTITPNLGPSPSRRPVDPTDKKARRTSVPLGRPLNTSVDIKVWTKGTIEVHKIIEHMEKIVNQTAAEYQFEWYAYLAEATRQGEPMDYNQFISDIQRLLEHATKLETPSIRTLTVPVNVPSWAVTSYLREIQKRFSEVHGEFNPDIYSIEVANELPCAPYHRQQSVLRGDFLTHHLPSKSNGTLPVQSTGILRSSNEVPVHHHHHHHDEHTEDCKHSAWTPYDVSSADFKPAGELADASSNLFRRSTRRFSLVCTKDSLIRAWNPNQNSLRVGRETLAARSVLARTSNPAPMLGSMSTPGSSSNIGASERPGAVSGSSAVDATSPSTRSLAVMFIDTSSKVQLYAYNWTPSQMDLIAQSVLRDTNFLNLRQHLVGNILHQKMGLFHHCAPMAEITTTVPPVGSSTSAASYRAPPQLAKMSRFLPPSVLHFTPPTGTAAPNAIAAAPSSGTGAAGSTGMSPSPSLQSIPSSGSAPSLPTVPTVTTSLGSMAVQIQSTPIIFKFTYENLDFLSQTNTLPSLPKRSSVDDSSRAPSVPVTSPTLSPAISREDRSGSSSSATMTSTAVVATPTPTSQQAAAKAKRRQYFAKLNDLKIDEILRRIAPLAAIPFHIDPVSRHASQFVTISEKYMRYHQVQQTLLAVYTKWATKHTVSKPTRPQVAAAAPSTPGGPGTPKNAASASTSSAQNSKAEAASASAQQDHSIDASQLSTLIHCARLIHSVKIPLFLSDMFIKEDFFEGPPIVTHTAVPRPSGMLSPSNSTTSLRSAAEAAETSPNAPHKDEPPTMRMVPLVPSTGDLKSLDSSNSSVGPPPSTLQPFLYSAGETTSRVISRPELNLRFEPSPNVRERQLKYRQELLNSYFDEFTTYLSTFGVKPVNVKSLPAHLTSHLASPSHHPAGTNSQASSPIGTPAGNLHKTSHSLSPSDIKDSPLANPSQHQSHQPPIDICPPKQRRYLQKVFRGGLILFEVEAGGPDNFFVSCNLFTLFFHRLTAYFGGSEDVIGTRSSSSLKHLAHFTREISNIKTQLHMNSFIYDFHVRHLSNLFTGSLNAAAQAQKAAASAATERQPGSSFEPSPVLSAASPISGFGQGGPLSASIPPTVPPVEVINQLQAMILYYENPPKHSRTALASSHITLDVANALLSPLELFAYATKHSRKFGFNATDWGLTPGVARVADSHEFELSKLAANATAVHAEYISNPGMVGGHRIKEKEPDSEDSWLLVAFMSHTSDATSATNEAISSIMSGGTRALDSGYNACYRVARQKHLTTMSVPTNASGGSTSHSMVNIHQSMSASLLDSASTPAPIGPSLTASASQPVTSVVSSSSSIASLKVSALPASESSPAVIPVTVAQTPSSAMSPIKVRAQSSVSNASGSAPQMKAPKALTISFFILRTSKMTTFPLMASAFATPPPSPAVSESDGSPETPKKSLFGAAISMGAVPPPPPTSLASYNRRNMHAALENCRDILTQVATRSIVESERDVLWSKLVAESAGSDFLNSEQITQLISLAYSRSISDLDSSLNSMMGGISTDWKSVMNQISSSFSQAYRTRVFLDQEQRPHLLLFNSSDTDLLLHLSVPDPKRIDVQCVRREFNDSLKTRHERFEAVQVSQIVNTICHLLWKQLLPKPIRR